MSLLNNYWNSFLDKTIVFSFDQNGFLRHKKEFIENFNTSTSTPKKILITGGTSGIGESVGTKLSQLGHHVYVTGRNQKKGKQFETSNKDSKFISLDMADWNMLHEFSKATEALDDLVFNAGSMPEEYRENSQGVEFQSSSQLVGHYLLLEWLKAHNKIKPGARIVWVSSGGMYLKKLDLEKLFKNSDYEKVDTYANVKRAQVTLVEELSKSSEWKDYFICSMHPGWVKTEGLKEALPKFYKMMKNRLRSVEAGADTIIWALLSIHPPESGKFYFDRKVVSPYITSSYSPSSTQREELMKRLKEFLLKAESH